MFETIVVGVDGREGGRDALALAASLQRVFASEVVAVHAFPSTTTSAAAPTASTSRSSTTVRPRWLGTRSRALPWSARPFVVADGSPGRALHRAASAHGADLIVVGSAHRGRVGRVLAGDVTAGTLHGAPCPVLVAPRGHGEHAAS
jgi:nucleotide-binding universal stress UspA family protein